MLAWCFVDSTASRDPSSVTDAANGRRRVFSSLRTTIGSAVTSMTKILDELSASRVCPLGEKENRKASPPGNAVEELALMEMMLTTVSRGRRYAANRFRRTSAANFVFRRKRSFLLNGPVMTLLV